MSKITGILEPKIITFLLSNRSIYYRLFEIRRTEWEENLKDRPVRVSDNNFCLCILFCTGNRKCHWYAGMITVNSELDSASNDIYFLNMQLFPW